ncbi:hypothetical protein, conserved [Eimeria brunetti]|uniref:Thioredoxin domain-containing protein n=1 Tax=Eimeria brunetti TaxID=51314 RepID=U6L704_9EIME|nr:hypothetical protein, conserved [Eimeria brunetti]
MATKFERIQITDENHFKSLVKANDDPRLFVVDVHAGWCGPCNAVLPTLKSLSLTLENFADRCCCVAADAALVPELAAAGASATPKFLLYKDGVLLEEIQGANAPLLKQKIEELAPPLEGGGMNAFS